MKLIEAIIKPQMLDGVRDALRHWWVALRCSLMGVYIGLIPGLGASIVDWFAYAHVVQSSKNKEKFGKGDIRGLIAPESDNNLWNYKFTWNPRNVVLAGQGGDAIFIERDKQKQIPYSKLFNNTESLEIDGYGNFEAYPNRDSLPYIEEYMFPKNWIIEE